MQKASPIKCDFPVQFSYSSCVWAERVILNVGTYIIYRIMPFISRTYNRSRTNTFWDFCKTKTQWKPHSIISRTYTFLLCWRKYCGREKLKDSGTKVKWPWQAECNCYVACISCRHEEKTYDCLQRQRTIFFVSNRSRTLIEAAPEKNWFDFAIEAAAYKRHNTVFSI